MSSFSKDQQVLVAFLPKLSSLLSMAGSSWIITEVMTCHRKRSNVYHRLLLCMSIYDILESIWNFASTWPIPKETVGLFQPIGTTGTCVTQGFFLQLGLAIPICT
jgi:hypothetical protein